jgi:Secretion system C-terminal sorting domain
MKQLHFLRLAALTLVLPLPAVLFGQDFVNGGFEKNGNMCLINASVEVFNANVKNTHAFGSFRRPDIAGTNCGQGDAKEGNWFIGLATNVERGVTSEAVTLELNQPLVKGSQYTLSFWTRGRGPISPNVQIGLSATDSLQGEVLYTVSAQSITMDWVETVIRFTAPDNGKYISVRVSNNTSNSGVWLDGFRMNTVFVPDNPMKKNTVPVQNDHNKTAVNTIGEIYPNPSAGVFKVNADSSALISLTVFNTLGTTVEEHKSTDVDPIPTSIDLSDQQPGLYFVELATLEGKVTKRIIVSR